jgi:hypothetical protein
MYPEPEIIGEFEAFERALVSGGDERIAVDPQTGRTRYHTPRGKGHDETWFSSSTASAISPRGYDAAWKAYRSLADAADVQSVSGWFDRVRSRLLALFGIAGSEAILSASGTELEIVTLFLARSIMRGPVTNLIVGPAETGRGVPLGAAGRHFLDSAPFAEKVERGEIIEGFDADQCVTKVVEIRDGLGAALTSDVIDRDVVRRVDEDVSSGRSVLIHLLDCSKTNRSGLRRSTASELLEKYGGRVLVVVDSCQLRCTQEQIRADLRAGFMVMITGSKFAGGPPFTGAILLPPTILPLLSRLDMPQGMFAYNAADDWPSVLRERVTRRFVSSSNVGMGLRWEAALAELERLVALPVQLRERVISAFGDAIERHILGSRYLQLVDQGSYEGPSAGRTIFPIMTAGPNSGTSASEVIYRALRATSWGSGFSARAQRSFHVGQPVPIGKSVALRVCLSAPQIVDVAERMAGLSTFDASIAPLLADLDGLFFKWRCISSALAGTSVA